MIYLSGVISQASDLADDIGREVQRPFLLTVERPGQLLIALQIPEEENVQQAEVTVATALAVDTEGLVQPKEGRVDPEGSGGLATALRRARPPS